MTCVNALSLQDDRTNYLLANDKVKMDQEEAKLASLPPLQILKTNGWINAIGEIDSQQLPSIDKLSFPAQDFWQLIPPCQGQFILSKKQRQHLQKLFKDEPTVLNWLGYDEPNALDKRIEFHFHFLDLLDFIFKDIQVTDSYSQSQGSFVRRLYYLKARQEALAKLSKTDSCQTSSFNEFSTEFENFFSDIDVHYFTQDKTLFSTLPDRIVEFLAQHLNVSINSKPFRHYLVRSLFHIKEPTFCTGNIYFNLVLQGKDVKIDFSIEDVNNQSLCFTGIDALVLTVPCKKIQQQEPCHFSVLSGFTLEQTVVDFETRALRLKSNRVFSPEFLKKFWSKYLFYRCYGFEIVSHSLPDIFGNWMADLSPTKLALSLKQYLLAHRAHNQNLRVALLLQGLQFCAQFNFSSEQLRNFFQTYERDLPPLSQASRFWQEMHSSLSHLQDFAFLNAFLHIIISICFGLTKSANLQPHPLFPTLLRFVQQEELLLSCLEPNHLNLVEQKLSELNLYQTSLQNLLETLFQAVSIDVLPTPPLVFIKIHVKPLYIQILKWTKSEQPLQQTLGCLLLMVAWKDPTLINEADFFSYCPYLMNQLKAPFLRQLLTDYLHALTQDQCIPVLQRLPIAEFLNPTKKTTLSHYLEFSLNMYLSLEDRYDLQPALNLWHQLNVQKQESYLLIGLKKLPLIRALAFLRAIQGLEHRQCLLELRCLQTLFHSHSPLSALAWNGFESSLVSVLKKIEDQELSVKEVQELFFQASDFWNQILKVIKSYLTIETSLPSLLGNVVLKQSSLLFGREGFHLLTDLFFIFEISNQLNTLDQILKAFLIHPSYRTSEELSYLFSKRLFVKPIMRIPLSTLQQHLQLHRDFSYQIIAYYLNTLSDQMTDLRTEECNEIYHFFLRKEFNSFFKQHPVLQIIFDRHYLVSTDQTQSKLNPLFLPRFLESFNSAHYLDTKHFLLFKENLELFLQQAVKSSLLKSLQKTLKVKPLSLFVELKNQQRYVDILAIFIICLKKPYELPICCCEKNIEPLLDTFLFLLNSSDFKDFTEIRRIAAQLHLEWSNPSFLTKKRFDFYTQYLNRLFEYFLSLSPEQRFIDDLEDSLVCWLTIILQNEALQPHLQLEHIQKWIDKSIVFYQCQPIPPNYARTPLARCFLNYFTSRPSYVLEKFELTSLQKLLLSLIQTLLYNSFDEKDVLDFCCQCFYHFKLDHLPTFKQIIEAFSKVSVSFIQSQQLFRIFQDIQQKIEEDITQDRTSGYYFCWIEILKKYSGDIPFALQDLLRSLFGFTLWIKEERPQELKDLIVFLTHCLQSKNHQDKQLIYEILWKDCYQSLNPFDLKQREIMLLIFESLIKDRGLNEESSSLKRCSVSLLQLLKFDFSQRHISLLLNFLEHYHGAKKTWEGLLGFYEGLISFLRKHLDSDLTPIFRFIVMSNTVSILRNALDLILVYHLYQKDKMSISLEKTGFYLELVLNKLSYTKEGCTYLALKQLNFNKLLSPEKDLKLQFKIALQIQDYQCCLKALIAHRDFIAAGFLTPAQKNELRDLSVEILVLYLSQLPHESNGYAFLLNFFKLYTPLFPCEDELQVFLKSYEVYFNWFNSLSNMPEKPVSQTINELNQIEYEAFPSLALFSPDDLSEFLQVLSPFIKKVANLTVYSTESTAMFFHFCLFSIHTLLSRYQPLFSEAIAKILESFTYSLFINGSPPLRSLHAVQLYHFLLLIRNNKLSLPDDVLSRITFFIGQTPLSLTDFNQQKNHLLESLVLLQQRNLKVFHIKTLQMIETHLEQIIQDRDFSGTIANFLITTLKGYLSIELSSNYHLQTSHSHFTSDQTTTVYALIQIFLCKMHYSIKIANLEKYLTILCNLSQDLDKGLFSALYNHFLSFLKRILDLTSSKDYPLFSYLFQTFIQYSLQECERGNTFFKLSCREFYSELSKLLQSNQTKGSLKQREKDVKYLQKLCHLL